MKYLPDADLWDNQFSRDRILGLVSSAPAWKENTYSVYFKSHAQCWSLDHLPRSQAIKHRYGVEDRLETRAAWALLKETDAREKWLKVMVMLEFAILDRYLITE